MGSRFTLDRGCGGQVSGISEATWGRDRAHPVSGAIERMRLSGNPRSVQDQLGHASPAMTLRYFRTLATEEALRVQEGVDFGW